MKKVIIGIIVIVIIIIAIFFMWYKKNLEMLSEIQTFNSEFDSYLNRDITGVDLTSVMNKAIDNNHQYEVNKNKDGIYENNKKNSIGIIIHLTDDGKAFPMEAFEKVGMREFTKSFGGAIFKAKNVEHHKNGRISKIEFEVKNPID